MSIINKDQANEVMFPMGLKIRLNVWEKQSRQSETVLPMSIDVLQLYVNVPHRNSSNQSAHDNTKLTNERLLSVFAGCQPRLVEFCFPFSQSDWVVKCQNVEVYFSIFIILFHACCGNWRYRTVGWWFFSENFRTWNSPCHVLCSVVSSHMQFKDCVHVRGIIKS